MSTSNRTTQIRVLVAGGGTAGHIEPALAVADALTGHFGAQVICLGTARGLETDLVPARGHVLELIDPVPVPRTLSMDLVKLPFRVVKAVAQTVRVIRNNNLDRVIGFGGYVAAPAYLAAAVTRTPFFVHEANARAGLANKLGTWLGGTGLVAYPDCGLKGQFVGMPVRPELSAVPPDSPAAALRRSEAIEMFGLDPDKKTVLVTGGSQGAATLNEAVAGAAPAVVDAGFQILHAYGKKNPAPATIGGWVALPFIDRMDMAYAAADLVVCRSGAMTVAEVTASATPAVYVPLPHGNGEQAQNAAAVIAAGAAEIIDNASMNGGVLADTVIGHLRNPAGLAAMSRAAGGCAAGSAAEDIARMVATGSRS
ncbi:glycosyltransferase [Corynebacterium mendelii]|uniref:UDP-N-acetylglucosamine--N-acetylmuramyl-(pentapeptide) pyrophosphoryl-undecaprenol N-acetylglucosamine transferase n=1 Tax=Corynebacterium mendelii TaxID=2765362 RepID=A0A939IWY4_9CORY|nr:UDP-N-acetylglucosamine--N-acetylmuramyl-(pentapeptide) pyrophosphoryl-undecaprenol N-acetylglucosamine transferase [Corynebacterium mendelii]MBN9643102.1 UDP-N-acetylglucosamine--N-acetylmuramyl-(pentapeptide) pyrophosphoryl-undecaprenol N-acetylglucosamine transferase [Corynebacterium mendelii]